MSLEIFLSHLTNESKLADLIEGHVLRDFLGLAKVFVSSDQGSVLAGSRWLDEITSALKRADLHVVLASPAAIERKWINFEAGAAHVRGIPIIPLCHSGLVPAQLPVPMSQSEGLVLSTASGFRKFYAAIAAALGSDIPDVDYAEYESQVAALEEELAERKRVAEDARTTVPSIEHIQDPRALCVSSQQFLKLRLDNQLEQVIKAFPSNLPRHHVLNSMDTRQALLERCDIVHIAAYVCPRSGAIYFSDVDLRTGKPEPDVPRDVLEAAELVKSLRAAQTRLVVITTSDALALATSLNATCHVVAARDMVSPNMMVAWVEAFYRVLSNASLSEALDAAARASGAPMHLYAQEPAIDIRVVRTATAQGV